MGIYVIPPFPGIERLSERELNKLALVAETVGGDPSCLANIIGIESGFNPAIQNESGHTGLIQFSPDTAERMGTTTDALKRMSAHRQLDYVFAFFRPHRGRVAKCRDLYLAAFLPAVIGKDVDFILGAKDSDDRLIPTEPLTLGAIYAGNAGLDRDGDGLITPLDLETFLNNREQAALARTAPRAAFTAGEGDTRVETIDPLKRTTAGGTGLGENAGTLITIGLAIAGALFIALKRR